MVPEPALSTIDRGCELGLYHQRICCCCCTLLYCCTTSWVGRLVRRSVVGSVGWWVGSVGGSVRGWSECVRCSGCLTCFVLLFSGPIMVSPLSSRPLQLLLIGHLLYCCCNTWWVGGSLRGRHCCTTFCCTAVSGWVDRFVAVFVCSCRVSTASWFFVYYFLFIFSPAIPAPR